MLRSFLDRYRLAFKALPVVIAVAVGKVTFTWLGWELFDLNPLYTGLVTGNFFLLGFLLVGVLADYKESEKLPGELAASVETIADECMILYEDRQAKAARDCLDHLTLISDGVRTWLHRREETVIVLDRITRLNSFFLQFESLTQPNFIVRLKQEQSAIRRMVIRINTIRETSFVQSGYTIAQLTTLLLIVGLLLAEFGGSGPELFLICLISFVLVYILLLIKDLDDPFDYNGDTQLGAAEVSLAPLDHLQERLARHVRFVDDAATN
ncbi:MAG: hypothetical protein WC864_09785 [Ilumatobacteraceae bacterium]